MTSRQNWGRAGAILISAALGAIGVRAQSLPLLIEVAAVVVGCVLVISGRREMAPAVLGDSAQSPLQITDAELKELMRVCLSKTDLQLSASKEYFGRWLQITGHLNNVSPFSKGHSTVTFQEYEVLSGNFISMQVSNRYQVDRILKNTVRGTMLTISGQVTSIGAFGVILGKCEIILIGQGADDGSDSKAA
jgi:hypothetical protein